MKQRARLAVFLVVMVGLTGAPGAGQNAPSPARRPSAPQTPTFRLNVEYVEVDAVVTDRDGQFVRGLRKEDFEIFEDGKPQAISAFSIVRYPRRTAGAALVRPGTDRARRQEQRASVRRAHLRHGHRRSPHEFRPHGARALGGAAIHPAEPRSERSDGGGPYGRGRRTRARSSPATGGCCSRPSIGLWVASSFGDRDANRTSFTGSAISGGKREARLNDPVEAER